MNLRKELLYKYKKSISNPNIGPCEGYLFRTIYDLPLKLTRNIYRFALEKYLPVAKKLWPDHNNLELLLNSQDENLEKLNYKEFEFFYTTKMDSRDMPYQGHFNRVFDSIICYCDSFRYLKEFGADGRYININTTGFNTAVIMSAILLLLEAWSPFISKNYSIFCQVPQDFKALNDNFGVTFYYRWYEIYEWLENEEIWKQDDIKNWKKVERDFYIWEYLHYGRSYSTFVNEDYYEEKLKTSKTIKKFICPEWQDIYGNLCEDDPQPHLTPDDPYDAV